MTTDQNDGYRRSHAVVGYGERYKKTYSKGYYFEQWKQLERPLLEKIVSKSREEGHQRCLDFACGTGRILSVLEKYYDDCWGVDVSEEMLNVARGTCDRSQLRNIDITRERFEERFDLITAFRFFLNAEPALRKAALSAINSRLNMGGNLIVNCHVNTKSLLGKMYRARNKLTSSKRANTLGYEEFAALLDSYGFAVKETYWYSYLPRTGWRFGWFHKKFIKVFDKTWTAIPFMPKDWAQTFLLVCEKVDEATDPLYS